MAKKAAGKEFGDSPELGITPLSKEEIDAASTQLDAFHSKVVEAEKSGRTERMSPKFWDDTTGTEHQR